MKYLFCSFLTLLAAAQTCAAQGVATLPIRVDSVVVRGVRERTVMPSQSFDSNQLTQLSANSVAEALRHFSGVQIKDYGGIGGLKTIDVHGLGSQNVGVFYDGIAVGNAQNGVVDLGRFSLDNVEAVSLNNGGLNSIALSAKQLASSSTLQISSKRPVFTSGKHSRFRATMKAGSFATVNPSVLWEKQFSSNMSGSVNAEGLYSSGKYRFRYAHEGGWDTVGVRTNGDIRLARIDASLFGDIRKGRGSSRGSKDFRDSDVGVFREGSDEGFVAACEDGSREGQKTGEWSAKAYLYASERGYPGAVIKRAPGAEPVANDRQSDLSFFAQSSIRQRFTNFYSLRAQAKAAIDATKYNSQQWRQVELYASATNLFDLTRWWSAALSADIQYNSLAPDIRRLTNLTAAATTIELPRFSVQLSVLHTFLYDFSASKRSIFSPSIAASWNFTQNFSLRGMFKRSFRAPTFNDLYYNDLGNRNLQPEFTTQWSAGLAFKADLLQASVDTYINRVRDKIVATPIANQFSWTMLNLGRVEIRGIDAVVEPQFRVGVVRISARAVYTFQDTSHGDTVPYLPRHSGSFSMSAVFREWSASWNSIFTGERYRLGSQTVANLLHPWQTHDISVSREVSLSRDDNNKTAKFTAQVNNIFNRRYEIVRWYPMPGTNVKLIITITL